MTDAHSPPEHERAIAADAPRSLGRLLLPAAVLLALVAVVVRLAWLGDDAYITLRSVENWLAGHGPNWNVAERVQTYTHPAWFLLLSGARLLTGESYFTTLGLGVAFTTLAAALLMHAAGTAAAAAAIGVLLLASRGFTEFATSGLENPLTHTLLAWFGLLLVAPRPAPQQTFRLALATGLLATTRLDLVLMAGPALAGAFWRTGRVGSWWRAHTTVALGLAPLLAWLLFAAFYYGTPFPITAYAKALATGLPTADLIASGLDYVGYVVRYEPATAATLVAGTALGLCRPALGCRLLAVGILVYCAYVVKVGGDFMAGRFASPPFVAATFVLARALGRARARWCGTTIAAAVLLACLPGLPVWLGSPATEEPSRVDHHGVVDERAAYYRQLGLFAPTRRVPVAGSFSATARAAGRTRPLVVTVGQVGSYAFEAGELVHVVDPWLCDPLLMRLPVAGYWRKGHFIRRIPAGYLETLAFGDNRIHHAGLRRYYDVLATVLRAPLWSPERLAALWQLWSGQCDADLAAFVAQDYRTPPLVQLPAAELAEPVAIGSHWFDDPRIRLVQAGGLELRWPEASPAATVRLALSGEVAFRLQFRRRGEQVGTAEVTATTSRYAGLQEYSVAVPAGTGPFDAVRVEAPNLPSDSVAALGGLVRVP